MASKWLKSPAVALVVAALALPSCIDGDDGKRGKQGPPGPAGGSAVDASQVSDEVLDSLDVVSEITDVTIASPPQVTFTLGTGTGTPITGIVPFWEDDHRYVRFTLSKLVPGTDGDPNTWVNYVRDEDSNAPDYDSGSSLVDNGDGSYVFTFNTDVTMVDGVEWEPDLTTRLAGQLGSNSVSLEPQNFVYDFVPDGGVITTTHNVATMQTCNECHDDLVFHGRRFEVEYCVACHNPDLAMGEGDMAYMTHRIHNAGDFAVLDDAISYAEVTYPQDLMNCRKCHDAGDPGTPDGDNWNLVPNIAACDGCHAVFETGTHTGGAQTDNSGCVTCHSSTAIKEYHTTPNATPNNPDLLAGQVSITYELDSVTVGGGNEVVIEARILSDGTPLDVANLPTDLADPGRYPAFLLAWAEPQDGIMEPQDYNNFGQRGAQPLGIDLDEFLDGGTAGTHSYDDGSGVNTFTVTDADQQFPVAATLRAVGLQGYFQQDIDDDTVSLHTPSAVLAVTGDDARRDVVDNASCANCHEWFEGHGGNRVYNIAICAMCHVPNQSSSGRTIFDTTEGDVDLDLAAAIAAMTLDPSVDPDDATTYPEDAQNLKDLVHGIHAADDRDRAFQHVRGPTREGYYDWSEITFPRGASTANCSLCHQSDSYELPLMDDLLPTTVRTTALADGNDASVEDAEDAFVAVPNDTDWINSPTASSCFYCHTSDYAMAHMEQNGGLLSDPSVPLGVYYANRSLYGSTVETCVICHGPGATSDVELVHADN